MTRINIRGQGYGTGENGNSISIDRTFPGALSGAMSEYEWTSFCDKVDEALAPAGPLRQQILGSGKYGALFLFVAFGIYALTFSVGFRGGSNLPPFVYPVVGIVFFLVFVCGGCMRFRPIIKKLQEIIKKVELVCEEESRKRSNVSFHLREERISTGRGNRGRNVVINYIECSVGTTLEGGSHIGFSVPPHPVAPTSIFDQMINNEPEVVLSTASADTVSSTESDKAERLRRLEEVRDIITEQEYTQRRKEILDGI